MLIRWLCFCLLTLVITFPSNPALADGHYLLDRCENALLTSVHPSKFNSRQDMAYCYGLLQGIRETNRLYELKLKSDAYFCLGDQYLSHQDSAKVVVSFLRQHPEILHKNETALAIQAFRQQYPCN